MKRKNQAELIQQLSDREITVQLVLTQLTILLLAAIGSFFLFDSFLDWTELFHFSWTELLWFGLIPGLMVLLIDFILLYSLPERYYDDGGINVKVFRHRSYIGITGITLLIAFSEEVLFRGVIHTEFGYLVASVLFAIMHIRYLDKIVLLVSVLFVSFFIGYMYEQTGSLFVTITAHFVIDFVLAIWIRIGKWGAESG
ncbi:CPBP family intramembrane glutamic endopeptidase [Halobacillus sp. BBL2006]|uniref:CPBP family intramembrane glutamic endopeptidase n=1 Tax=Halobacillus sp. BBL2006 TaxID=1543706 RepID=UPI0005430B2E|nr:CPBP family intramembrane glutamic endopeptidase [Halobacillus sp. BBL2006]KHE69927.1 membrane protein [Halobacillus sp. BBL2006]